MNVVLSKFNNCHNLRLYQTWGQLTRFLSNQLPEKKGLVLGVYSDDESDCIELTETAKKFNETCGGKLTELIQLTGNKVKPGKSHTFWGVNNEYAAISVVGLGPKAQTFNSNELICENHEAIRIAAAAGCKALDSVDIKNIDIEDFNDAESAAEGSHLGIWKFQDFKTKKDIFPTVQLYNSNVDNDQWKRGVIKATAQNLARRLADTPANLMTPTIFAEQIYELLKTTDNVRVDVHDQKWAESECMGAFLAVSQGSKEPPKFLEIHYDNGSNDPVVMVGKGVTFDAGGISLKPSGQMDEMRADMMGAACVAATAYALPQLNIKANVKFLIPLTENLPSGSAIKPGDVIRAKNNKTICIDNTDAEGRLILADALVYSSKYKPKWILDIATLTGAMRVALGNAATGVFTNSDQLYKILEESGSITGDRVWRFPLWKHFTKQISENTAYDLNNIGKGSKGGGSCTAAAFLKEFVPENTDWLHLDIAGVMGPDDSTPYLSKGMTGRPTRTLIEFIAAQFK